LRVQGGGLRITTNFAGGEMPRDRRAFVYVGIKGCVVALDRDSGDEMWRADLRSAEFVSLSFDGTGLFAANSGEAWRLDPATGEMIWHNQMKGLGRGLVSLASSMSANAASTMEIAEEKRRRDAATAAAAAAG
jgi:outer membrane protein assembly factor BamB